MATVTTEYYKSLWPSKLLTAAESNAKTAKDSDKYLAVILHLSPATKAWANPDLVKWVADGLNCDIPAHMLSQGCDVCPAATPSCRAACLDTAGRGKQHGTQRARARKTLLYWLAPLEFRRRLHRELTALSSRAEREGKRPVVRLNGTSDVDWTETVKAFPNIQFYDYTKRAGSVARWAEIPNYHITFSRTETNESIALRLLERFQVNAAVVFRNALPATWRGYQVIDGTTSDWRFDDPRGVIVGLIAKGKGKRDTTGFVLDDNERNMV